MKQWIFMTGATSGLGKEAALTLAQQGAHLFVACRTPESGKALLEAYSTLHPDGKGMIEIIQCDLASLVSVRNACKEVQRRTLRLDQLILNAGIWNFERQETVDGIEEIFQVNLLSPALIIQLLLDTLKESNSPKIILTASALHQGTIQFDDIEFRSKFSGYKAYRQSKLGIILLCRFYYQELKDSGVGVYCFHPGVVRTNLDRKAGWFFRFFFKLFGISPTKGAQTLLFLSHRSSSNLLSGEYYAKKKVVQTTKESNDLQMAQQLMDVIEEYF